MNVPEIGDIDVLTAALKYASAGFYVLPVEAGSKHPGSIVKGSWQTKSTREPEVIVSWFAGTNYGIALHLGRSGAVALDVDYPDRLPEVLTTAITGTAPHQSTRDNEPGRGHYLFAMPAGRILGNGTGKLGGAWGEIRGTNGVIIAAPSRHEKADDGGRYQWVTTGPLPVLPDSVADLLTDSSGGEDSATDAEVHSFLDEHTTSTRPGLITVWVELFQQKVAEGESRHQRMVSVLAGAMSEARAGYFPARDAMSALETVFLAAVTAPPVSARQGAPRGTGMARSEWMGIGAWAVAQAKAADLDQVRARVEEKLPDGDNLDWIGEDQVDLETGELLDDHDFGTPPTFTGPAAGKRGTFTPDPGFFFDRIDGLRALQLAKAVDTVGPIASDHGGGMYRYDDGVWCDDGERIIRARVVELLQDRYRMSHGSTVIDMLRTREPLISEDRHDTTYLNLPNGLLEWRTGQLHPHDPTIPSVNRIPIEWDPDATCPEIEAWIGEVFPDDTREFVEEVIGYCLLNDNPLHKAILLYGKGRNGKGTLLRLLALLIGQRNISSVTPQSLDENRFRAAELFGKLANLVGDVDPKIFTATETFKQITGGDRITAERKYGQPFSFTCRALMIAAFNALPRSSDTSEGFFSRWIVVPFTGYFPPGVADPGREDKMHTPEELRGLLVLAVRGLARVMGRRRFDLPETVEKETARFRRVADPVRAFLDDWLPELLTEFVPRKSIYSDYADWCTESGYNAMAAHGFFERVEAAGNDVPTHAITPHKRTGTRGYLFIKKKADSGAAGAAGADTSTPGHAYGEKSAGPAPAAPGSAYAFGWDEET